MSSYLTYKLKKISFSKYLRLHIGYHEDENNTPGALLANLNYDSLNVVSFPQILFGTIVQVSITIIVLIVIGFYYQWIATLIALGGSPVIFLQVYLMYSALTYDEEKYEIYRLRASEVLSESINNSKTVICYCLEDKMVEMYSEHLRTPYLTFIKDMIPQSFIYGISQSMFVAFTGVTYLAGVFFIKSGKANYSDYVSSSYSIIFGMYMGALTVKYLLNLSKAVKSLNNLAKLRNEVSLIDPFEVKSYEIPSDFQGKIEFKNVSFTYPSRPVKVLDNISFVIKPGEKAAFIGHSGSGKSTIIQLIERFYDVTEGQILIDNVDIKRYSILDLRRIISLVSQEPTLFKRSVKENILYGNFEATDEEIQKTCEQYKVTHLLSHEDLPVSGGEKQRIAIARAMVRNPKILMLDEATSALDKKTEKEVQEFIDLALVGRTSISVAHR